MKKILKHTFILTITIILATTLAFTSCSKKEKTPTDSASNIESVNSQEENNSTQWQSSKEKICLVYGYGYNSKEFVEKEIARLETKYGISDGSEDSGLIIPLVFPDDFKVGNTGRISKLISLLEDVEIGGVITIGAPEYTNNTLATLRENMTEGNEYPIYTLFPQDDILAIEATSDFVLDKAVTQSADNISQMQNENEQTYIIGIEDIIDNAIDYIFLYEKPLASDSELQFHVSNIAGTKYKITRYIDPETGLSSINHFIIGEPK